MLKISAKKLQIKEVGGYMLIAQDFYAFTEIFIKPQQRFLFQIKQRI